MFLFCLAQGGIGAAETAPVPVVTVRTPAGQMKYDRPVIVAKPGSQIRLIFENLDEMPHNFVLCRPLPDKKDKGLEVAQLAWTLGAAGMDRQWIPESPRILAHTGMVAAHQKEELLLRVPEEPGTYPYVCTFPGHAMAMNGELRVLAEGPGFSRLTYQYFPGEWSQLPDFDKLTPHRQGEVPGGKISILLEGMTEHFGVRFDGELEIPADGIYQFFLASDDGSRLWVNGKPVIDLDGIHPASGVKSSGFRMKKGKVPVRLDYFEHTGEEQLYLAWSGPTFQETPLSVWVPPGWGKGLEVQQAPEVVGMPLAPSAGEAIIYRNFIRGVSPRAIAVGYPNGVNLCFDADQMAPALFWQGAFLDAKRHWTDRGSGTIEPLGYNEFRISPPGPGLAVLPSVESLWPPVRERAAGLRFRGYRLLENRFPAFQYDIGSLSVVETYQPAGSTGTGDLRVSRTLQFSGPEPVGGVYVRAAGSPLKQGSEGWSGDGFRISVETGIPQLRGSDLVIPVTFTGATATVALTYHWLP